MNIGLLVTELEDSEVKRICIGASRAAKDKEVTLVIMPGKYLVHEQDEKSPYSYQYSALFDYACTTDFDALIIDIDRIGKNVPILKKEAFLKKFGDIPVLTLTEQEGYFCVNEVLTEHNRFEQIGYEAVSDAAFLVKNGVLPPLEEAKNFTYTERPDTEAIHILSEMGSILLHRKYISEKKYQAFLIPAHQNGINN